jgi:hypothetical protein
METEKSVKTESDDGIRSLFLFLISSRSAVLPYTHMLKLQGYY